MWKSNLTGPNPKNKLKLQLWEWRSELLVLSFGDFRTWNPGALGISIQPSDGRQIKLQFVFLCSLWNSASCMTQVLPSLLIGLWCLFDLVQRTELQQTLGILDVVVEDLVLLLYNILWVGASPLNVFATGPALCKFWTWKCLCSALQWSLILNRALTPIAGREERRFLIYTWLYTKFDLWGSFAGRENALLPQRCRYYIFAAFKMLCSVWFESSLAWQVMWWQRPRDAKLKVRILLDRLLWILTRLHPASSRAVPEPYYVSVTPDSRHGDWG